MSAATTTPPSSPDRLALTLFLAVIVHGLVILGVGFSGKLLDRKESPPLIEITLATLPTEKKPQQHDFLAQANQEGGGDLDRREIPRKQQPVLTPSPERGEQTVQAAPRPSPAPKPKQQDVVTSRRAPDKAAAEPADDTPPQRAPSALDLVNTREQVARASEFNPAMSQASSRRPSKHFISAATSEHAAAAYMRQWIEKVERVGNLNYPEEARRRGLTGSLVLDVTLNPDGSVANIAVNQPSAYPALDQAAMRIVRLAGPYAPVPASVRQGQDQLVITRTWKFTDEQLVTR